MAETKPSETPSEPELQAPSAEDMEVEPQAGDTTAAGAGDKRAREDEEEEEEKEKEKEEEDVKKQKSEKSVEEERLEKAVPVELGPKKFETSVVMYDYFYKLLHFWSPNVALNKYEHLMLLELLKKGHSEPEKKIGGGIRSFHVKYHPKFKSRCFFLAREDGSEDDFSFRKCVDQISPLPENMQVKHDVNKALGGGRGGRGGGRGGRGNWKGGKNRN